MIFLANFLLEYFICLITGNLEHDDFLDSLMDTLPKDEDLKSLTDEIENLKQLVISIEGGLK